jgi:UDP-sulfoquinovose synthase
MRVLIAGVDGYLGWPLAQHLAGQGHIIGGIDNQLRRRLVAEAGGESAVPITPLLDRLVAFRAHFGTELTSFIGDMLDYPFLRQAIDTFQPDAIVHLAEIPSAPYSMRGPHEAAFTQHNNVIGSLNLLWAMKEAAPQAHLLKLGTMGEYGTPNIDIPEGFFEIEFRGRRDILPFPRHAGSFYHWSKVHDSYNVMFACRVWGLRSTDVMQGVVYGTRTDSTPADPQFQTRLDFDAQFGTVINRFCCQAVISHPLTVYGSGEQTRSFLPLTDSIQCMILALENPPEQGEYRVFNQFDRVTSMLDLARIVQQASANIGIQVEIAHLENPRRERENHYYNPQRQHLTDLGYTPQIDPVTHVQSMLGDLLPHKARILTHQDALMPTIHWDGTYHSATQPAVGGTV